MSISARATATLLVLFASLSVLAEESRSYCAVEVGRVVTKYTNVFDGPSLRIAAGYQFTPKFGLETAYEYSGGGTAEDDFWRDIDGPTRFDNIHMASVLGTAEWNLKPQFSFISKLGVARGTVDYRALDADSRSSTGSLTETNVVVTLGFAMRTKDTYDVTFSVKHHFSANFFGLGDSFDSTTLSVGVRRRF